MNINHLKYFYDAARLGSLSKSAELNFVGQPAITKGIQNLESVLGVELLVHKRNQLILSDKGQNVLELSQQIFSSVEALKDAVHEESHELVGSVSFACQSSMAEAFLGETIKALDVNHPKLQVKLSLGRTDIVCKWVRDQIIDLGVVIANVDLRGFDVQPLRSGHFHLVGPSSFKGSLKNTKIMHTEDKNEVLSLKQKFLSHYKQELITKHTIGSWGVIKKFTEQGLGIGFLPDYLIQKELKEGSLKVINKATFSVPYEMVVIHKKNSFMSQNVKQLIKTLVEVGGK